jgi:DNA invertase Pin-like site-specific DNA recombinase
MTTVVYQYQPQPNRRLDRWLTENPGEVSFVADADPRRPELLHILTGIAGGTFDRLVVPRLGDLGLTARRLADFLNDCRRHNVTVVSVKECFNLSDDHGVKMATFLAGVAQDERDVQGERQRGGIERAKAAGRRWGGRHVGTRVRVSPEREAQITKMFGERKPIREIAEAVALSIRTVYRAIANLDATGD